jgi:hypothetical protein
LCTRAHLPDALGEATALPRDRQVLLWGDPIALIALELPLAGYNKRVCCALSAIGIPRAKWRLSGTCGSC